MKLATKTLIAIMLGVLAGLCLSIFSPNIYGILNTYIFSPIGELFIKAIKMIVIPLVFSAVVLSITSIGSPKKLGQLGGKTVALFVVTTMIACTIGITTAIIIGPGKNIVIPETSSILQDEDHNDHGASSTDTLEIPTLKDTILNIIPSNPFEAFASGDMLQVLTFSIFFGFGLVLLGDKAKTINQFIHQLNELMMKLVQIIMKVIPFAAFSLVATSMGTAGLELVGSMVKYLIVIAVGLIVHVLVTYGSMISLFTKFKPIHFFHKMTPAIGTAFATSSSAATLPVTKSCCENDLKISHDVSSFVLPLGMTINMNGASLSHGVAAVFVAQLNGIDLGVAQYLTIIFISLLASIGAPAIPGGGIVSLSMVFLAVGLPIDGVGIAIILGLFRLVDMALTSVNVLGDAVCASIVDKSKGTSSDVIKQNFVS
ncbi:dicarboxylate/amino acid:cation symporter (plasmid) [Cytobacillus firmus]|uniref:Dicarboxylate/amino acid:cation symporter n=1 Tax=Cytobacillus firmus TaxID=1399 RepID=A0AA46PGS7_CYTFI|nr:dicarboxylate/amino acid:cation symporter [Cytobacillus firmus]USK41759.1 dicarboxylate/amino acid:cation symporter [Cytobacillus firmus]UYG98013.1 dicarboxylate/amino acid:cation symporter [Cytobacillus firmus]